MVARFVAFWCAVVVVVAIGIPSAIVCKAVSLVRDIKVQQLLLIQASTVRKLSIHQLDAKNAENVEEEQVKHHSMHEPWYGCDE